MAGRKYNYCHGTVNDIYRNNIWDAYYYAFKHNQRSSIKRTLYFIKMILHFIIYALLIAFAAMFKAVSDVCADHYSTSIFTRFNPQFWDKSISWGNKYKKGWKYWDPISDAWHISNGLMISCFIAAGIWFPHFNPFIIFLASGVLFTVVFNTFYNHIFKIK